jgi:hypothetical protein
MLFNTDYDPFTTSISSPKLEIWDSAIRRDKQHHEKRNQVLRGIKTPVYKTSQQLGIRSKTFASKRGLCQVQPSDLGDSLHYTDLYDMSLITMLSKAGFFHPCYIPKIKNDVSTCTTNTRCINYDNMNHRDQISFLYQLNAIPSDTAVIFVENHTYEVIACNQTITRTIIIFTNPFKFEYIPGNEHMSALPFRLDTFAFPESYVNFWAFINSCGN